MSHIVVATGVQREAATLGTFRQVVIPGGGDSSALRRKLEDAAGDAIGIVSFGFCGALDPRLRIGDWIIGERLVGAVETICDREWIAALREQRPTALVGAVYSDGRLIATAAQKAALASRYDALIVDMESHVAASVAMARALPFAVLRCVSDEAGRAMPPAIAVAMRPDGSVNGPAMLRSIVGAPGQIPDLIQTIRGFLKAMRALKKGAGLIAPPYTKTARFSAVTLVSSEYRDEDEGDRGWGFDLSNDEGEDEGLYRRFLEELVAGNSANNLRLETLQDGEDVCVEGWFDWRGIPVRARFEPALSFLSLWSSDQATIADLRGEVLRLSPPIE